MLLARNADVEGATEWPLGQHLHLCARYQAPRPRKPLNLGARALAGFTPEELAALELTAL